MKKIHNKLYLFEIFAIITAGVFIIALPILLSGGIEVIKRDSAEIFAQIGRFFTFGSMDVVPLLGSIFVYLSIALIIAGVIYVIIKKSWRSLSGIGVFLLASLFIIYGIAFYLIAFVPNQAVIKPLHYMGVTFVTLFIIIIFVLSIVSGIMAIVLAVEKECACKHKVEASENVEEEPVVVVKKEIVVEEVDEKDNDVRILSRYNRSFKAKLIQSEAQVKDYYKVVKNHLLSYKKVHARMSWSLETFSFSRNPLAKLTIRGKTLTLYLALDPNDYEGTKYNFEDVSDIVKYQSVPLQFKIKSDRKLKYSLELIDDLMKKYEIAKNPKAVSNDYPMPFESTKALIKKDLIRLVGGKVANFDALNASPKAVKPVSKEEKSKRKDVVPFDKKLLAQSKDIKDKYNELKSHILSYGVKSRVSSAGDTFRLHRQVYAIIRSSGKHLQLYLPLDVKDYENSPIPLKYVGNKKKYIEVPSTLSVKSDLSLKRAFSLVNDVMKNRNQNQGEVVKVNHIAALKKK